MIVGVLMRITRLSPGSKWSPVSLRELSGRLEEAEAKLQAVRQCRRYRVSTVDGWADATLDRRGEFLYYDDVLKAIGNKEQGE